MVAVPIKIVNLFRQFMENQAILRPATVADS